MNDIYSFYQLISKCQIEIPIIQRDYAQGRNNSKAADVRKSLVDNMIKAVKEDKPLFFDFVYGRVDNNKFIPFDGQQRLTTLFLFHKYVFEKCQSDSDCNHKDNCSCRSILGRFSYATRQSSREFCEKLVENNIIPDDKYKTQLRETFIAELKKEVNEKEKKADEFIKSIDNWIYRFVTNQPWFYPDWEKDPTIMGMLTMLDEIHCQMRNETDFKTFAEKLTSGCNCPITFHFVDMGEHKMSDETYVKMNARGKTLTPFENFKASLEQYLEDKKLQDLQNRLKNKIDGDWLDLFWNINGNVLPDTLMMSFFNRHFMNIWRSWYANNSKSEMTEIDDAFNTRIQKEMPLYPTKDNFVPFDIYEYVIDKCGVDECLTPIFNIYDELCGNDNNIENDCQAVWNRSGDSNGEKWDLFQKNVNDETYKSRTAFYALLRYHENSNNGSKPTLEQWMRIVWNIIENYVEREESYIPALQLIETIAENGFDIAKLGDYNGVARDQVKEEIAKAKQILDENGTLRKYKGSCKKEDGSDYQTWEEIIIDAESYAFFKGAIRFLFQNENGGVDIDTKSGTWNTKNFDTKLENAQKYFDENGVKNDNKVFLTKSLVIQCDNWNEQLYDKQIFNPNARTWKWILTAKNWIVPVHNILRASNINDIGATNEKNDENVKKFITPIIKDLPFNYFITNEPDGRFRWLGPRLCFYKPYGRDMATLDWENWYRNKILSSLLGSITTGARMGDSNLFWGWNIKFSYNNNYFQWYGNPNEKKFDVYLMENDWADCKERPNPTSDKGTDEDNYYCFRVTEEMETDTSLFTKALDCLIKES